MIKNICFLGDDLKAAVISFGIDLLVIVLSISKKTQDQFEKTLNVNNNIFI